MVFFVLIVFAIFMATCSFSNKKTDTAKISGQQDTTLFSGDSAYSYLKSQVDMGPRVPGSQAHNLCADYLESHLHRFCDSVIVQNARVKTFDSVNLDISNFVGIFNPESKRRILLLAHWDCRPWADQDVDPENRKTAVDGANDGASGVAVLMELARIMHDKRPNIGVDILFVDAEDWGDSSGDEESENTWALGTQYWTANMHRDPSEYSYGILLDMVGTSGAKFKKEFYSEYYASDILALVWQTAAECGYADYFVQERGGGITDDHVFVMKADIPCIDIIDQNDKTGDTGFFPGWHTTHDDMGYISASTLNAVGATLERLIYKY